MDSHGCHISRGRLSLSLSLSHTHTHTISFSHSLSHTHKHTKLTFLSLFLFWHSTASCHLWPISLAFSLSLSLTHCLILFPFSLSFYQSSFVRCNFLSLLSKSYLSLFGKLLCDIQPQVKQTFQSIYRV